MFFAKKSKANYEGLSKQDLDGIDALPWYNLSNIAVALMVIIASITLSLIAFFGNHLLNIQFLPGNDARSKIVAEIPFSYESKIETRKLYEQRKNQFIPIFHVDEKKYDGFIKLLKMLDENLEQFSYTDLLSADGREEITEFIDRFNMSSSWHLEFKDIATLISSLGPMDRTLLFQECVSVLREIASNGVADETEGNSNIDRRQLQLKLSNNEHIRTKEEALYYIRMHLLSMNIDKEAASVMFKILKTAIRSNLVYDEKESNIRLMNVLRSIGPVTVHVNPGDILLETDAKIKYENYEALFAYRKKLQDQDRIFLGIYQDFFSKTLLVIITVALCVMGIKTASKKQKSIKKYFFYFGTVLCNLIFLRLFIQIGELNFFTKNFFLIYSIYCIAPFILASIIATLIDGVTGGIVVSCIVSTLYTLMLSRTTDFFLSILLTNLFLVFFLKRIKIRGRVVRGGFLAGLLFATIIVVHGVFNDVSPFIFFWQSVSAVLMGVITSILALGLLPIFEKHFSMFTDISFLELTDYNNPILKRMQIIVPGTYHHCLMVSNISEQVAGCIGANTFICKAGALYHDIGKMIKPEYFIENQNNGINLHSQQTPYISSLIIRSHVKEGIEIAKQEKMPPEIISIIAEHHGTTLVRYFYNRAQAELADNLKAEGKSDVEIEKYIKENLDEATFRYDGPRPQSKESAIVMLADSIEAASRSLKKVTHQSISNMLDDIFSIKLSEHQFDECPITLAELKVLKKAFAFTLVNMLHSRISYAQTVIPQAKPSSTAQLMKFNEGNRSK